MGTPKDTIAAIATPPGKGGIGIIRVSGENVPGILKKLFGLTPTPRQAHLCPIFDEDNNILDRGLILYFEAPNSYTGEHIFEWQGHGGPVILNLVLKQILKQDVRLALPGEFTERAFLNDKIDLTQAEAVADLIESSSEQAARAATRNLEGAFSKAINELQAHLIYARSYIEATLDFPEEEIDFLTDEQLSQAMIILNQSLQTIIQTSKRGRVLKEGMTIVILGSPNVGKSSLLNSLAQDDTAIVTDVAGTTRDVLKEHIQIDGIPLHIIDTAGLRSSPDKIEQEGIKRAWNNVAKADRVLLLVDDQQGFSADDEAVVEKLKPLCGYDIIYNKLDLSGKEPFLVIEKDITHIGLSAKTGIGLDLLMAHLKKKAGFEQTTETAFIARQRHVDALNDVAHHVDQASEQLKNKAGELAAESLKEAQQALSLVTGEFSSDDLLGKIFSSFCIGK